MKKYYLLLAAALFLFSCVKEEQAEELPVEDPETEVTESQGWKVSISATMGADSKALAEDPVTHKLLATFETADEIYVYNRTKNALDSSPLHPDSDGASVLLTGTLNNSYDEGDELVLCYKYGSYGTAYYSKGQKGTLASASDFARAELTVSADDAATQTITGSASFVNMQSIFGFNFSSGGVAVPARAVEISTEAGKLVSYYRANPTAYQSAVNYGKTNIVADAPISGTLYAGLSNDNTGDDTYYFRVNDGAGHLYSGSKAAPAGKIVNGKYYASSVTLTPIALPTVTLTASGTPVGPNAPWDETLTMYGWNNTFLGYANYGDLTISGNTAGCWFVWLTYDYSGGDRTITLDNATVTQPEMDTWPLCNQEGTFTVVLNGNNTISTTSGPGIDYSGGESHTIWIKGDGTLTITCETPSDGGTGFNIMYGVHDRSTISSTQHPNPQAADGYNLTISSEHNNGDGTSTWVYEVHPMPTYTIGATPGYTDGGDPLGFSSPAPPSRRSTMTDNGSGISTAWEAGDKVWVLYDDEGGTNPTTQGTVLSVDGSGNATVAIDMVDPQDGGYIMFGYPYRHWNEGLDPHEGQRGTLDDINSLQGAISGGCTMSVAGGAVAFDSDVDMTPEMAIWKLSFSDGTTDITDKITTLIVHCGDYDEYIVSPPSPQSTLYVALYPQADSDITLTAHTSDGIYSYSKTGVTLDPGMMYTSTGVVLTPVSRYPLPLASATAIDLGAVIGADGNVYLNKSAATTAGTTAMAMIACLNSTDRLAIAMEDLNTQYKYDTAIIMLDYSWASSHAISGLSGWRIPTEVDWEKMDQGIGLNIALDNVWGATLLTDNFKYWSSTDESGQKVCVCFVSGTDGSVSMTKTLSSTGSKNYARACIPF